MRAEFAVATLLGGVGNSVSCAGGMLNLATRSGAEVVVASWEGAAMDWRWLMGSMRGSRDLVSNGTATALTMGWRKREAARTMLRTVVDRREGIISLC